MGFLGRLIKQLLCLALLLAVPYAWYSIYMGSPSEIPQELATSSRTLISFGVCLVVEGAMYRSLPYTAIRGIPLLGGLDDTLAGAVVGVGAVVTYLGWAYGSGDKPQEAVYVVETVAYLYELSLPALKVLRGVAERALEVLVPIVTAAAEKAGPTLSAAYNAIMDVVGPLVAGFVAPKVMEATQVAGDAVYNPPAREAAGEL